MLRITKTLLILVVASWGLIAALQNFVDWHGTLGAVGAATSMATFEGGAESWQATSNNVLIWLGALFIVSSKILSGGLCLVGSRQMWRARRASAAEFQASKHLALSGCAIALFMLFGGFIVIAESWFELWRSDVMRGPVLDSAFRYGGMIALIALFVSTPDDI
jgi:predicted small integral membrane protein